MNKVLRDIMNAVICVCGGLLPPAVPAIAIGAYLNPNGFPERIVVLVVMVVAYVVLLFVWKEVLNFVGDLGDD